MHISDYDQNAKALREAEAKKRTEEEEAGRRAAAAKRPASPPMSGMEQFFLFALGFLVVLAGLFFVIGYAAATDIRNGTANQAWSPGALVRALPVLMVLGLIHFTALRRYVGATTATCYSAFLVAVAVIAGPERAAVLSYFTLITTVGIMKDCGPRDTGMGFVMMSIPWLVFIGGALAGFFDRFPSWSDSDVLRAPFSVGVIPTDNASVISTILMFALVLAAAFLTGMLTGKDRLMVAPIVVIVTTLFLFIAGMVGEAKLGLPEGLVTVVLTAWVRVTILTFTTIALLEGEEQDSWKTLAKGEIPPVVAQNPVAFLGLLAMVALELLFGFEMLSLG